MILLLMIAVFSTFMAAYFTQSKKWTDVAFWIAVLVVSALWIALNLMASL